MKKVFVSQSLVEVETLKERLGQVGIRCMIKNRQGSTLAGAVPFVEVFPELWIVKNEDYDRVKELMSAWAKTENPPLSAWTCPECGENHTGEFTACWKCGKERSSKSKAQHGFPPAMDQASAVLSSMPQIAIGMFLGVALTIIGFSSWEDLSRKDMSEDRNADGKTDAIYSYSKGVLRHAKIDDDFDGYFETSYTYNTHGVITKGEIDRNQDGKPDLVEHYTLGKFESQDFLDPATGKVKKRAFYKLGVKTHEMIDQDGDGKFERTVQFDKFESPLP